MSNSPMRGIAGYHPAEARCIDAAEIQRKRDALRSKLAILEEARRRLEEIQHDAAGDQLVPVPGAGGDDFYPLDDADDDVPEDDQMQWQHQVCRQMIYNSAGHPQLDGGHLAADSDNHDLDLDDDGDGDEISRVIVDLRLHVLHIQQAAGTATNNPFVAGEEAAHGGAGFGAIPASAAAIAGLEKHRYDGTSGGGGTCVICMRDYKKGRRLRVVPCKFKHRFHGRCIREWLSRSNLCPLCRHALPTEEQRGAAAGGGGVHRNALVVRANVNRPY